MSADASAVAPSSGRHIAVAVDGSDGSAAAFSACLLFAHKDDMLSVVHIQVPGKDVPHHMTASAIQTFFEARCVSRFPTGKWAFDSTDRPSGMETKRALLNRVNDIGAQLLVVGFTGRKGPKDDPTILGSAADYSLRAANMPCCVVKRKVELAGSHVWVVAVDGSDRSHQGLLLSQQLCGPEDKIIIAHVAEGTSVSEADAGSATPGVTGDAAVSERYVDFARAAGGRVTYSRVDRTRGTSVSDCLLDFAEDAGAEFITVGVDGLGRFAAGKTTRLGSTSDAVVRRARCNVLVAQEAGATFTLAEAS